MNTVQPGSPASPVPMKPLPSASFQTLPLIDPAAGVQLAKSATPGFSFVKLTVTDVGWNGETFQPGCTTSATWYVPTVIELNAYVPPASVTVDGSPAPSA